MTLSDQTILDYIAEHPGAGRAAIQRAAGPNNNPTTVWRALRRLVDEGRLEVSGKGRATGYTIAGSAVVRAHLQTPYNRRPLVTYRSEFLDAYVPGKTFYLSEADRKRLLEAGRPTGGPIPAGTYARRILEQLLVDLAWASSRMEGNTYDILQTERLIRFGEEVAGKDRKEALMILNHKEAIQYLVDHLDDIALRRADLFAIHALLSDGLLGDPGTAGRLRAGAVGISHSSYKPVDDAVTIGEEFDILLAKAAEIVDSFEQSFFLLVHIPYLQAFIDINKRTSRVASNIPLLKADLAPMSFLTMDDADYIDGLIGIYELNNVALLREVYIDSYLASAEKYRVLRAEVETPEKAALTYREFVREAVRRCVLEFKAFRADEVMSMAVRAGIPEDDREAVVAYVNEQVRGLHEGNAIRYRLRPADLDDLMREGT
ncbi:Fic family protein [Paracoccus onubensis]|nr:Fic family protein [Paracoccus onubensis]